MGKARELVGLFLTGCLLIALIYSVNLLKTGLLSETITDDESVAPPQPNQSRVVYNVSTFNHNEEDIFIPRDANEEVILAYAEVDGKGIITCPLPYGFDSVFQRELKMTHTLKNEVTALVDSSHGSVLLFEEEQSKEPVGVWRWSKAWPGKKGVCSFNEPTRVRINGSIESYHTLPGEGCLVQGCGGTAIPDGEGRFGIDVWVVPSCRLSFCENLGIAVEVDGELYRQLCSVEVDFDFSDKSHIIQCRVGTSTIEFGSDAYALIYEQVDFYTKQVDIYELALEKEGLSIEARDIILQQQEANQTQLDLLDLLEK